MLDTRATCHKLSVFFLMRPQLLNCLRVLLRKLSHMGAKVIQEKYCQHASSWGLAPPQDQHPRRSLGGRTSLCFSVQNNIKPMCLVLWDCLGSPHDVKEPVLPCCLLRCLWALELDMGPRATGVSSFCTLPEFGLRR